MVGALWTGISGLGGSQTGLDNESNNIANVNTIGFKASRVSFADQMYQDKIGKGVTSFDVEKMYTQGNLKNTGVSYDMALSGDGFFQVKNGAETYYTRAGNFRMGEGGTLEDVGQNKVQGWAIQPLTSDDIVSTDPNAKFFTNDFTKLLGNKVIRDTTSIETIATKATDYTATATTDNPIIFSGSGYKTASTKIADVEMLVTEYNAALSVYAEADPKPTASSSSTQKDLLSFGHTTATDLAEGDEVYVYIDGVKYSQTFDTNQETTMKKFVDTLSDTPGFKAYLTGDAASPFDLDSPTDITASNWGNIVIESIVPGQQIRVTELGWTDASNSNLASKGTLTNIAPSVLGTGMGHISSIEKALQEAVSGKQTDVYDGLDFDPAIDYTYQIEIYDKNLDATLLIPPAAMSVNTVNGGFPATVDDIVSAINTQTAATDELADYVEAFNINGNLVVRTKDANNDVEFTGVLTGPVTSVQAEVQTLTLPTDTGNVAGGITFDIDDGTTATAVNVAIANGDTQTDIANNVRAAILALGDARVADVTITGTAGAPIVNIEYTAAAGDMTQPAVVDDGSGTLTFVGGTTIAAMFVEATSTAYSATNTALETIARDPNYSNREGAGAEFLKIGTTINQTASKSELQLRLDTLGLTDSAFGDFEVDNSGMVTMTQDGVRFAIGQVSIARFTDNRGLEPVGDNLLMETTRSGSALFNINNDKMAEVKGGTLELSTADLSESLVNLMVFQRAFEANAKSITTADQILTTLIQLKR